MPSGSDGTTGTEQANTGLSSQLAFLVPSFDPSKDDMQVYQQKVQLVFSVWPASKISELITRLILNTSGSAFAKLQLHHEELCVNEEKGIKRLIELLGGHWGQIGLERRYADAEKALFQCNQQGDESHDSYLARADILWTKLLTQKLQLEDLQAYVTLRGSMLTQEEKKRVILDSDNSLEGKLTMVKVREAVRMLGASFFQEMTGSSNKKVVKSKVYDQSAMCLDDTEPHAEHEEHAHVTYHDEWAEDDFIEGLMNEGDEDAVFVTDFETAATEIIQADEDLASAYSTYVEARRKLSEKYRSRGFWPLSKGKGKYQKGKGKGKFQWGQKKTLQQRILESNCRLCGKKGHWKSECPSRGQSSQSAASAPVTLSMASSSQLPEDVMSTEFLLLPEVSSTAKDTTNSTVMCFVQSVFSNQGSESQVHHVSSHSISDARARIRNHIKGNKESNSMVASLVNRIEERVSKLNVQRQLRSPAVNVHCPSEPCKVDPVSTDRQCNAWDSTGVHQPKVAVPKSPMPSMHPVEAETFFASHDTWGILDTGATKTVMGSNHVSSFLQHVQPSVRDLIKRCPCEVVFRFGNQGTLKSEHAMVVPMCGLQLKIAIVPGATPFLISNTLLRALGALVDTENHKLILPKHHTEVPLKLSEKGLYLIDMNMLLKVPPPSSVSPNVAETFAQDSQEKIQSAVEPNPSRVSFNMSPDQMPISPKYQEANAPMPLQSSQGPQVHRSNNPQEKNDNHKPPQTINQSAITSETKCQFPSNALTRDLITCQHPTEVLSDQSGSLAEPTHPKSSRSHEQLGEKTAAPPEHHAASGAGVSGSPDTRCSEGRESFLREDSQWQDFRGSMELCARLDPLVSSTLRAEPEPRTSEDDQVYQTEDRKSGERRGRTTVACPTKSQASPEGAVGQSQEPAGSWISPGARQSMDCGRCHELSGGSDPGAHGKPGECPEPDPGLLDPQHTNGHHHRGRDASDSDGGRVRRPLERSTGQLRSHDEDGHNWALQAGEIDQLCESLPNHERRRFWSLVANMEKELETCQANTTAMGKAYDLFEVFCSPDSKLTDQVQSLKGTALRFGLAQGNLQTTEGRRRLFVALCRHRPKHVWMSPVCKPWSQWSNLNQYKSDALWNKIQAERHEMLVQVALCLVLCRHQHRVQRHAHWEQPRGSHMMSLPYLNELGQYMLHARPDMCVAGDLQDPVNQKYMRKSMHIMSTSRKMYETLNFQKCHGEHEHQPIEGSTSAHGQRILRSKFSENYSRKFARMVAKTMMKAMFPLEKPVGSLTDPALTAFDLWCTISHANAVNDRSAKRQKLGVPRQCKASAEDRSLSSPASSALSKRRKVKQGEQTETTTPKASMNDPKLQIIMDAVETQLPRVGKKSFSHSKVFQQIQELMPEKIIHEIIACKGTERTIAPPSTLSSREAPYRRSIMKLRSSGNIIMDEWEKYDELAKRKIIRKSKPCRVNITVFAANPVLPPHAPENVPAEEAKPTLGSRMEPAVPIPELPVTEKCETKVTGSGERPIPETERTPKSHRCLSPELERSPSGSTIPMQQPESPVIGNRFNALPREEQSMLRRAHQNLCHPSPEQLSAVLRAQGARPELTQAVFDMRCTTCAAHQKPKVARPSTFKSELDFNDKIFIDGITWTNKTGKSFHFYHIIDQATNFHVAIPAPCRAAEQAVQCVLEGWFQWAGPPNIMVTDSATEFTGEIFTNFLQRHDVKAITTAPHAHWQNGRCERHGQIIQSMLDKIDHDMPVQSYLDLHQALVQSTHAKNTLSIRKGYSPEVLVFGKSSRIPGSITSCENEPSMASADRDDAQGISFRRNLELREKARVAFHRADNDMALRRAIQRRSRPDRDAYSPGEWVMMWQPAKTNGYWFGPLKVINQEDKNTVWATHAGKIYRRALEHVRPVCSNEANQIPMENDESSTTEPSTNNPAAIHEQNNPDVPPNPPITHNLNNPENSNNSSSEIQSQSQDQPDLEPEANSPSETTEPSEAIDPAVEIPVPESTADDDLVTTHLLSCEDEPWTIDPTEVPCAWRCEFEIPGWMERENLGEWSPDDILIATTEKKQRTEVKLTLLSPSEQKAFAEAKETEIQNWLKTGTVSKVLRSNIDPEQILKCRWILTWKPREDDKGKIIPESTTKLKSHKPKARLVVLGYMDPQITEVPRDSPTLGKQSKMIILQLIASMGWSLGSFDIKAAFLQGKPQKDRIIGLEPVIELAKAMNLKNDEICRLDKSAYGLIDAPFLWFQTLCDELKNLGFTPCPFDPCVFILRNPKDQTLAGVLGIHVDDGIHGGNQYFQQQIAKLESKYPFGSKKSRQFTFTGIDLHQTTDNSIELSQSNYVKNINPISLKPERRAQEDAPVTEEERHLLRGLIGSLQYAAVHTRPDLSSALSQLQSQINNATVTTLIMANKTLHTAKKHHDVTIKIKPIAPADLRFIAFSDASFASKSKPESYAGMIVLATHKDIAQNKSCVISPLSWGTKKIQRVVTSTLSAETSALSTTLDQLTWMRVYWAWLLNPAISWQKPETIHTLPKAVTVPTIKIDENDLAITDCKSLYDLTTRTAVPNCQEFRTQLLARSIKDVLSEGIKLHWVHSGAQLADALTKIMESHFLRETLRQGKYCLHDIHEVLKNRASARNRLKWLKATNDEMSSEPLKF